MRSMLGEEIFKRPKTQAPRNSLLADKLAEQQLRSIVLEILNDDEVDTESKYYLKAVAIAEEHEW
jgi:hypothetical protein